MNRYNRDKTYFSRKGLHELTWKIRKARDMGIISYNQVVLKESQRLDHLAHKYLGNSHDWWILAAMSDIGWGLQIPPGTIINVPINLNQLNDYLQ